MTNSGRWDSAMRWVDRGAALLLLLGVVDFGAYAVFRGHSPAGGIVPTVAVALALAACAVALFLPPRSGGASLFRRTMRVVVLAALIVGAKVEYGRMPRASVLPDARHENILTDSVLASLTPDFQLKWALRIMAHAISVGGATDSSVVIPAEWPYPKNIRVAVAATDDSVVLAAVGAQGTRTCRFTLYLNFSQGAPLPDRHDPVRCGEAGALTPPGARIVDVRRQPLAVSAVPASHPESEVWPEYRRAADRDADDAANLHSAAFTWRAIADGEVRATPSVADGKVLVGTHGAGVLHAFDLRTGRLLWKHYVPNWIHQDAVSDGHTVLVGFGDTQYSQYAWTPAGVSAFSLANGALLWSAFEGNAVMTSPVIWRQSAVYITSAGVLKVRDLQTGAETARLRLPGRAVMASPTLRGDTLVASLDDAESVCAIRIDPVAILWCTPLAQGGMGGTSAPTVAGGRVYASAAMSHPDGPLGLSAERWHDVKYALGWMRSTDWTFVGQRIWALDLATGHVDWQSPIYPAVRNPGGHISGTAVVDKGNAITLLPLTDTMVALDSTTGKERWAQNTGASRGPAAYSGGRLFLTLHGGELRVVNSETGKTECSVPTKTDFDRAGPAVADSSLLFGSLAGVVYSMPLSTMQGCDTQAVQALVRW